jgi:hypothetical protein
MKIPGRNEAIDKPMTDQSNWTVFQIKEFNQYERMVPKKAKIHVGG